jgi:hypothetical protein
MSEAGTSGMGRKRKALNSSLQKDSQRQKQAKTLDPGLKIKCLTFVIRAHGRLAQALYPTSKIYKSIDGCMKISSAVFNQFISFKQRYTKRGLRISYKDMFVFPPTITKTDTVTSVKVGVDTVNLIDVNNKEELKKIRHENQIFPLTNDNAVKIMDTLFKEVFGRDPTEKDEAIGLITTYIALIHAFGSRLDEIKYPIPEIIVQKSENKEIRLRTFGLNSDDVYLMSGYKMQPDLQSAIPKTLGPMLICVNTIMANPNYSAKWENAFKSTFKALPNVDKTLQFLKMPNQMRKTMSVLKTFCELGRARTNKAYINFAFIAAVLKPSELQNFEFDEANQKHQAVANLDFSGEGFWRFVNCLEDTEFLMRTNDENVAQQFCVLAMTGLHLEDLTTIDYMTGVDFKIRNDSKEAKFSKDQPSSVFKFPKFKFIAKFASSIPAKLEPISKQIIMRLPVFSGRCTYKFDLESAIYKLFTLDLDVDISGNVVIDLIREINSYKKKMLAKGQLVLGHSVFYANNGEIVGSVFGDEQQMLKSKGKFFYSNKLHC